MTLAKLVGETDKSIARLIEKLEGLSGYNSEDVRLLAEIKNQTAEKIASLGLDPADTTGEELYHALQAKLRNDAAQLAYDLDFNSRDGVGANAAKLVAYVSSLNGSHKILALRQSSLKTLLRQNPPKRLMKRMSFRSVESMLKRGNIDEIIAAADQIETNLWHKGMSRSITKLSASDYEVRPIRFIALSSNNWSEQAARPVTTVPLTATVAVWPSQIFAKKEALYLSLTMLQASEILETDNFYLSQHQFKADFGRAASELFLRDLQQFDLDEHKLFDWTHLRKLVDDYDHPLAKLAKLHPALAWWQDAHYLALIDDEPVSINLGDNLKSLLSGVDYKNRHRSHLAHRLKAELLARYGRHQTVRDYIASKFDDTFIETNEPAFEFENVG